MKGSGTFNKLTLDWQAFVNKELYNAILKEFPFGTKMTQKSVAKLLVNESWIEKVQLYTWRSARASGLEISFEDFKTQLVKYKLYDGKSINAWKNSYEPRIGKKFAVSVKSGADKLASRIKRLESGYDVATLNTMFKTVATDSDGYKSIRAKLKQLNANWDVLAEEDRIKKYTEISNYISTDIRDNQYPALVKDRTKSVLAYQGKRLAQDQLQRANNEVLMNDMGEKLSEVVDAKEDVILVGFWTLSSTHKHHYYPGGDPCERHANHDAGYGKGSYVGDIPIPVKDSHYGCKCGMKLKVLIKK